MGSENLWAITLYLSLCLLDVYVTAESQVFRLASRLKSIRLFKEKKMAKPERQSSKQEEINLALQLLLEAVPELRGALVSDNEGLPIAHQLPTGLDPLRAAAIAATVQGLGNRAVEMLKTGVLTEVSVAGTDGLSFLYAAGSRCVLVVLAPNHMNVGMIHLESRECAKNIASVIG
jgi:uncharacterized protein